MSDRSTTPRSAVVSDYWTLADHLHFSDYKPALSSILRTAQTPVTVGVFGPWGSGKTSLLRQLRDDLEQSGNPNLRTVWFTAWKYDREEALWRAFILRVLDALYPRANEPKDIPRAERARLSLDELTDEDQRRAVELLDRLQESVYRPVTWQEMGRLTVDWLRLLREGGEGALDLAAELMPVPGVIRTVLRAAVGKKGADSDQLGVKGGLHREIQSYHREQLLAMEQFEAGFAEAIETVLGNQQTGERGRLVVFVDDLDRCLPEKAVEVLEAIKLFLEVPGTVFILGMDREVVVRGVEARYGALFGEGENERRDLPIKGDTYLQKIVQIPFRLPPMAVEDVASFIDDVEQEAKFSAADRCDDITREVFARGLYPNPRQVKRALNIFRLLKQITLAREGRDGPGSLPSGTIAWPLLAKTIVVQTQFPDVYALWQRYPTLLPLLEEAYTRRPTRVQEILQGVDREPQPPAEMDDENGEEMPETAARHPEVSRSTAQQGDGGILGEILAQREKYALLEQMLRYPPAGDEPDSQRRVARFAGLTGEQMEAYVRLAGTASSDEEAGVEPVEAPADLLDELLSGDRVRVTSAMRRIRERAEDEGDGLIQGTQQQLLGVMGDESVDAVRRAAAGDALSELGDPRFRADLFSLPDDPMLGFVEIPAGPFTMGTDEADIDGLMEQFDGKREWYEDEVPQHEVEVPTFYMARFPVTVAQFQAYVEATGNQPEDKRSLGNPASRPVRWVSWHEALGYARWLHGTLAKSDETPPDLARLLAQGWRITLPSEAEWEKAARGGDGRTFPWGDEFDANRANFSGTGIGDASAVGCFPGGVSPLGIEEMIGNLWEWTRSHRQGYPYPVDPEERLQREELSASDDVRRVVRGGSWHHFSQWLLRAAARDYNGPYDRVNNLGFRVVASPSPLPSDPSAL